MPKLLFSGVSSALVFAVGVSLLACSEKQPTVAAESAPVTAAPANANSPAATATAAPAPVAAPVDATAATPAVTQNVAATPTFSPEALETLLAPVALYPDSILAQVLASSTNPQEVLDAGNWLIANPDMKGKELNAAATALGFTPPTIALMQFPSVVDMMCMKLDWTTELGTAFLADEPGVLEAVQRLRKQAADMGNLQSSEQMKVTTEEKNDQQVIVVQPANPEVVYVPQYNPTAVYTTPAPAVTTPVGSSTTVVNSGYSGGQMVATGLLSFGAGMLVNEVFNDDDDDDDYDDYYRPNWGYGGGGYYPPPYYPRYGNGYRPANGYNRPANYQRGFNNNNVYVDADGNDYFNKFNGGRNNYRNQPGSPISKARNNRPELGQLNQRAQTRPATLGQAGNRKAQGSYAGAKPGANRPVAQRPAATSKVAKGTYAGASNPAARQKLNPQSAGARDRGHTAGKAAKPAARPQQKTGNLSKPATRPQASKPAARQNVSKPAARKAPASRSNNAFQGSRNHGKSERAASNRGRSSMQKSGRSASQGRSDGGQRGGNRR